MRKWFFSAVSWFTNICTVIKHDPHIIWMLYFDSYQCRIFNILHVWCCSLIELDIFSHLKHERKYWVVLHLLKKVIGKFLLEFQLFVKRLMTGWKSGSYFLQIRVSIDIVRFVLLSFYYLFARFIKYLIEQFISVCHTKWNIVKFKNNATIHLKFSTTEVCKCLPAW